MVRSACLSVARQFPHRRWSPIRARPTSFLVSAPNISRPSHPNGPAPDGFDAQTLVVEPLGSHLLITATFGDQLLKVVTRADFDVRPGQPLRLRPEIDKVRWLRSSDGAMIRP